jgi:hypothetical protein
MSVGSASGRELANFFGPAEPRVPKPSRGRNAADRAVCSQISHPIVGKTPSYKIEAHTVKARKASRSTGGRGFWEMVCAQHESLPWMVCSQLGLSAATAGKTLPAPATGRPPAGHHAHPPRPARHCPQENSLSAKKLMTLINKQLKGLFQGVPLCC